MATKTLFLASSSELKADRQEFEIFINRKNKAWHEKGIFLDLILWEDFLEAVSRTRLQDEYNQAIRDCDIFVMLFASKVGKYTAEEFETAFGQFKATNKPFIFTYFKKTNTDQTPSKDLQSRRAFQKKLRALGHFATPYEHTEGLLHHFNQQLDKLAAAGFRKLNSDPVKPPSFQPPRLWWAALLAGVMVLAGIGVWAWTKTHPTPPSKVEAKGGVAAGRDIHGSTITIHGAKESTREEKPKD
jgi:hypothetical protein